MPTNTVEALNKSIETCRIHHGCDYPMQSSDVREKSAATLLNRYGVDNIAKVRYLVDVDIYSELNNAETVANTAMIIADRSKMKDSRYYMSLCRSLDALGVNYVIVWPWEDVNCVRDQLCPTKDVFAEDCEIYRLTDVATKCFLLENDYKKLPRGAVLSIGHIKNGKIVQVLTFGKVQRPSDYYIKLISAVTRRSTCVVGGFNQLSKAASIEFGVHHLMTKADRAKPAFNKLYPLLGFREIGKEQTARHIANCYSMYDCGKIIYGT